MNPSATNADAVLSSILSRRSARESHADARALSAPAPPPAFPHLPDRRFTRGACASSDSGALSPGGFEDAHSLPPPPLLSDGPDAAPRAPESALVQALRAQVSDALARFDFRHVSTSVAVASFLETLPASEFSIFRATVLARHASAASRALDGYAALEARLKGRAIFPEALNDDRVRARAACDMRRASGVLNLDAIAQSVLVDMKSGKEVG